MTSPFYPLASGDLHRLQGLDLSGIGPHTLYLAGTLPSVLPGQASLTLGPDDWLGSGTFRNSFYAEAWRCHSQARDLWLVLDLLGHARVKVMLACPGQPVQLLQTFLVEHPQRQRSARRISALESLPPGARLFWHLDAVDDGATLFEAAWCTRSTGTPERPAQRLAVLMRTWGRAAALRELLHSLHEQACHRPWLQAVLDQLDFWVLDTSPGAAADWAGHALPHLHLRLLTGPNLGGGGNASHLLMRFIQAHDAGEPDAQASELLILDDDLSVSLETLARYLAFCSRRQGEQIWSLPVLMKSQPSTVWEDGAFWGRRGLLDRADGQARGLAPHLVRHGLRLDSFEPLDGFGPLNQVDYATFIFFGLSLATLRRIGLPAAMFLRGDDVELSLRAQAHGVPVLTLPTLAAWHEPAHSHAQEYMAILHGVLINLHHSPDPASRYLRWFEQRLLEHSSCGDLAGLAVYQQVLDDLLDPDSTLLQDGFHTHYPPRLQSLNTPGWAPLANGERERLHCDEATGEVRLLPYLYPGLQPQREGRPARVVMIDHGSQRVRAVPEPDEAQRLAAMQRYLAQLGRLAQHFAELRPHWRQRLTHSGTEAFWREQAAQHAPTTQVLRQQARAWVPDPEPPLPASLPLQADTGRPLRELRQQLEAELSKLQRLREALDRQLPATTVAPAVALPTTGADPSAFALHPGSPDWTPAAPAAASDAPAPVPAPTTAAPPDRWRQAWSLWARRLGQAKGLAKPTRLPPAPPDFDPRIYLALHADVARTGIDPLRHYLQFGLAEGRRYRP